MKHATGSLFPKQQAVTEGKQKRGVFCFHCKNYICERFHDMYYWGGDDVYATRDNTRVGGVWQCTDLEGNPHKDEHWMYSVLMEGVSGCHIVGTREEGINVVNDILKRWG
jgi:hypothetical protein